METGVPLVEIRTSEIMKQIGVDPSVPMSFKQRLEVQDQILSGAVKQWQAERQFFVSDRSPLCFAMYTLADVTGQLTEEETTHLLQYVERCFALTNSLFTMVMLLQPGIPVVDDPNKATAALNKAYMEHLNTIMTGLIHDERLLSAAFFCKRATTDLKVRVRCLDDAISRSHERLFRGKSQYLH